MKGEQSKLRQLSLGQQYQQESFLQTIIDGIPDAVLVIDTEYRAMLVNRAARDFAKAEEGLCEPLYCYCLLHQLAVPCADYGSPCPLVLVRNNNNPVTVIHEHYQADGQKRIFEVNATPLTGTDGSFLGIIESMHDITDRHRAEEERWRFAERLRALAARLADVTETERQRLARELHDQVGQNLTALGINLNILRNELLETASHSLQLRLDDSLALVMNTTECIRNVMAELRPPVLDDYGLVAALDWYGQRFEQRTNVVFKIEGTEPEPRLAACVENTLFRIVQEALNNVAKHALASRVSVTVDSDADHVRLGVVDDGVGFDSHRIVNMSEYTGWGLLTMTERAEAIGGRCCIDTALDKGTSVVVEIKR